MASTVRDAVDSVLTPALRELRADIQATNNSVKELRVELEALASAAKQTRDRVDSVQAAAREDRRTVTDLRNQLVRLTEKMIDMEDRSRRNNVRLVILPEGAEGSDAAGTSFQVDPFPERPWHRDWPGTSRVKTQIGRALSSSVD